MHQARSLLSSATEPPRSLFFFFELFTGNVSSTKQSDEPEQATALIPLHG
jgi:hypothetical protein